MRWVFGDSVDRKGGPSHSTQLSLASNLTRPVLLPHSQMTAPPMPTADDFAAQGAQDPLAPPSASLFPSSGSSGGGGGMSDLFGVGAPGSENDPEFSLDSDFGPTDPGNSMLDPAPSEPKMKGWW